MSPSEPSPIALVTGGNRGIGYEVVSQLAVAGHRVLLGARDAERGRDAAAKLCAEGHDVECLELEVTDPASVHRAARYVDERHGSLDVLVNNAGILLETGEMPSQTTLALVRRTFETNVFAVMVMTNAMLPLLRRSPAARVVNLASQLGSMTLTSDPSGIYCRDPKLGYSPSKSALARSHRHVRQRVPAHHHEVQRGRIQVGAPPISMPTPVRAPRRRAPRLLSAWRRSGLPDPPAEAFSEGGALPW